MKKTMNTNALPLMVLLLGAAAAAVRGVLYLMAMDEKGLLARNHPLSWLLLLLCAACAALVLNAVPRLKGSQRFKDNFEADAVAALGSWFLAAGILLTLLQGNAMERTGLVRLWQISGVLSAAGLVWAGVSRKWGRRPFVGVYAALCLFFALHMVSRYQPWSGDPQSMNWILTMLATVGLALCAYHHSAFSAGVGHRCTLLATGLLTVFFCCAALPHTEYFWLYLTGGVWAYTGLCRVTPVATPEKAPEAE